MGFHYHDLVNATSSVLRGIGNESKTTVHNETFPIKPSSILVFSLKPEGPKLPKNIAIIIIIVIIIIIIIIINNIINIIIIIIIDFFVIIQFHLVIIQFQLSS